MVRSWRRANSRIPARAVRTMSETRLADTLNAELGSGRLWLMVAAQRKKLGMAARRMLSHGGLLALRGGPDLSLELVIPVPPGTPTARGVENCNAPLTITYRHTV